MNRTGELASVRRITWIGLLGNILLAGAKLAAGILGSSRAVVADAVHSIGDTSTDVAILIGVRYWSAPADDTHPHGHHRIETVITVSIGLSLAAVAVLLGHDALVSLREAPRHAPPRLIALVAALVSILGKEVLYRWTVAVGRQVQSTAVMANAWHHRSDALSSCPVAIAVGACLIDPAWAVLDHVGAAVVSIFILGAAWRIVRPALGELVDRGAPADVRQRVAEIAAETHRVREVHAIRTRYAGSRLRVDLHVTVDGTMTVREGHDVSEEVKQRLLAHGPDVIDVVVHLEPHEGS
jgi:cation diffusion facilitator family transporter